MPAATRLGALHVRVLCRLRWQTAHNVIRFSGLSFPRSLRRRKWCTSKFLGDPQLWHRQPSRVNTRWHSCLQVSASSFSRGCLGVCDPFMAFKRKYSFDHLEGSRPPKNPRKSSRGNTPSTYRFQASKLLFRWPFRRLSIGFCRA